MSDVNGFLAAIADDADGYLAGKEESTVIVGASIAGDRGFRGFRSADAQYVGVPEPDSLFEIGSFSKVFLASTLAVLEAEGVVALDDTIARYLPTHVQLPPEVAAITLFDLATHSSGFDRLCKVFAEIVEEETPYGSGAVYIRYRKEHLYEELAAGELTFPRGKGWAYSIVGMGLLGHILELATGDPWEQILKRTICEPLGLADTTYTLTREQQARMVRGYEPDGTATPNWYHDVLMPQGGLRSTAQDLLAFAEANVRAARDGGDDVLSRALRRTREVHLEWAEGVERPRSYGDEEFTQGLAWWAFERPTGRIWFHPGSTVVYQSSVAIDENAEVALIALTSNRLNLRHIENLQVFPVLQRDTWLPRLLAGAAVAA
ncbi:MAG TPA: serine hydrolase domain-containing protein [Gaiellaceae bacterium]|nr:serine hydrolase domain-containing protein [Gaiellaceae bacterium]